MATVKSNEMKRIADYSRFFNAEAKRRLLPIFQIREEYNKLIPEEKRIPLDEGLPNAVQFPILQAKFTSRDGSEISIEPDEMKTTLQYGDFKGIQGLREWTEGLFKRVHNPPTMDGKQLPSSLSLQITSSGREGITRSFGTLLEDGDSFVAEGTIYQSVSSLYIPRRIKGIPIRSDDEGMDAGHLRHVLSDWDERTQGRRPRLLYVTPTCSNPTGRSWSERRKKEIYNITREFDLLIIEDDPYYYLQFKKPQAPSFLSMDTEGRVIYVDSFTKTLSPGCRTGILFAPTQILETIQLSLFHETGGASGFAQMMIYKVVDTWGHDKFLEHVHKLASFYKQRADITLQLANKYLTGLCEWRAPDGGVFLWLKLLGVDNSDVVAEEALKKGVYLMPGSVFTLDRSPTPFARLCYSLASDEQIEQGISVLADVLKRFTSQTGKT